MKARFSFALAAVFIVVGLAATTQTDTNAFSESEGRWKVDGNGGCYWDENDTGGDQCDPNNPAGRYRLDGGSCVWDASQHPPNECEPGSGGGGGGGGGGTARPPELGVWADLASSDRNFKLSRVDVSDGNTIVDSVGGLEARRNWDPNDDYYMYFNVDDGFAHNGSHPNIFITFHYWDVDLIRIGGQVC